MPTTNTYAKLGRTTWRATVDRRVYDEARGETTRTLIAAAEFDTREQAQRWTLDTMTAYHDGDELTDITGDIESGTYEDNSFTNPFGGGRILDAEWSEHEYPRGYGYLSAEADAYAVEWTES